MTVGREPGSLGVKVQQATAAGFTQWDVNQVHRVRKFNKARLLASHSLRDEEKLRSPQTLPAARRPCTCHRSDLVDSSETYNTIIKGKKGKGSRFI